MAEQSQQLVLDALNRVVAAPSGMPLFGGRTVAGLFGTSAAAKKAAQGCKDAGYLQVLRTETKGKASCEICAISEKGLAYLLAELSPKQVLEAFVYALEEQSSRVEQIAHSLRGNQDELASLKNTAVCVLEHLRQRNGATPTNGTPPNGNGKHGCSADVLGILRHWHSTAALGDCPLPNLYRALAEKHPNITLGQFHDALRQLQDGQQIYLHPWTGPLYEIPEPKVALMVGHEIAWYASLRE